MVMGDLGVWVCPPYHDLFLKNQVTSIFHVLVEQHLEEPRVTPLLKKEGSTHSLYFL